MLAGSILEGIHFGVQAESFKRLKVSTLPQGVK